MTIPAGWRMPLAIAAVVVVLDQLTKHWALTTLADGHTIHVIWTLQFNLAFNSGMAFGRGQGLGPLIGVLATVVIVWLLLTLRNESSRLSAVGMGLLLGGAAGNLADRLFRGDAWFRGSVVDFIDFQWFPIFNIADMSINIGAALLILGSILQHRRTSDPDPDHDPGPDSGPDAAPAPSTGHDP